MTRPSTKQIIDEYYNSLGKSEDYIKKIRSQCDRPEVYEYEEKLGKSIFEMNVEELLDMMMTFKGSRLLKNVEYSISYSSFNHIASRFRDLFNFYINNYEIIKNPFYDKRMRGVEAQQYLLREKEAFTTKSMENIISKLKVDFVPDRAAYMECLIRLCYDGFSGAQEIVALKEEMIDKKFKTVRLPGRIIHLSDRTFFLLNLIHDSYEIEDKRFALVDWENSYFKFIVRKDSGVDILRDSDLTKVANTLNRMIIVNVKNKYGIECNLRTFYLLGFYDKLVERFGKQRTYELLTSVRNSADANDLVNFANLYGVNFGNVTILKKNMRPFVELP